jgi:hypothetical protein
MSINISRRDFIAFGAGVATTIGGALALSQWVSRDVPISRPAGNKVNVFLHIPKTGGTSLREHIMDNVKAHQITMPERPENIHHLKKNYSHYLNRHDYIYVRGHFANDWQRFLNDYMQETQCFTMLRDPIARFRSSYQYQVENWLTKGSYIESVAKRTPQNLSDVIDIFDADAQLPVYRNNEFFFEYNDGMTRRLCGAGWNNPYRQTTPAMLDAAKANLKSRFKIIGVTEEYNKFLFLLKNEFDWDIQPSIRKNVAKKKMHVSDIDRDKIAALNQLDIELHAYATQLSERLFEELSPAQQQAYESFITL